jgi:AcrR family transcriptional regulator
LTQLERSYQIKRSFYLQRPFQPDEPTSVNPSLPHHPVRSDGIDARQRLMGAGLKLFSEHGFEKTSVRELAREAQVNVAAVSYYFGDKTGLYRALFTESFECQQSPNTAFADPGLPLDAAMSTFFGDFLRPLNLGDEIRMVMKLHFREMAEPTGAWECALESDIRPQHEAMMRLLVRTLGLRRSDIDVQRLAIAIAGMAVHVFVFHDGVKTLAPQLLATPRAIDTMAERLAGYAVSMIEGERLRRAAARQDR